MHPEGARIKRLIPSESRVGMPAPPICPENVEYVRLFGRTYSYGAVR